MQSVNDFPYVMNFRWWRNGKLLQKQLGFLSLNQAKMQVINVSKVCIDNKCEWLGEIFPRLGLPIVQGSPLGLKHHKDLF